MPHVFEALRARHTNRPTRTVETLSFETPGPLRGVQEPRLNLRVAFDIHEIAPTLPGFREIAACLVESDAIRDGLFGVDDDDIEHRTLHVIQRFVEQYLRTNDSLAWNDDTFERVFTSLDTYVTSANLRLNLIGPLDHFSADFDSVDLADGIVLRRITVDEKKNLWEGFGSIVFGSPALMWMVHEWTHVVIASADVPKHVPLEVSSARRALKALVSTLRILKRNHVENSVYWTTLTPPVFGYLAGHMGTPARVIPPSGAKYELNEGEVPSLRTLLARYRDLCTDGDRAFQLAIRRWNAAYERERAEDRIVDFWVALEALFLPDGDGELSYRIRLRLAQFVGRTPEDRRAIFRQARESYQLRSTIVHGRELPGDADEKIAFTEDVLRSALKLWVDPSIDHQAQSIDNALLG